MSIKPPSPSSNAKEFVAVKAKDYYTRLWIWLISMGAGTFVFFSIGLWAGDHYGWQAGAVEVICKLVGSICALTLLMFITLFASWRKAYVKAVENAEMLLQNPEMFQLLHRDAVGPIPWSK